MSILVSPRELYDAIYAGDRLTVLACLWGSGANSARNQFHALHIPTAQLCDISAAMAGLPGSRNGRNPLPDPDKLQEWFVNWGLRKDRPVVVYDEGRGLFSGRAWWILRWAGIEDVRVLDGGLAHWRREQLPTLTGPGNISVETNTTVDPNPDMVATLDEVKEHDGILIDTREPNRFAGRRENLDLKAGHIPGAVNVPERYLHHADRTWKNQEEILEVFHDAGINEDNVKDAIVYSGSGNHSGLALATMDWVGLTGARHYVGGWSQWSADATNPVERGDRVSLGA
ncbi:sulfurtransferase [uncultured Corynebacterium sp.]|uniref:sulfurtransferase n=1 Tax=uncultured Corynebacterium sp. TaxID=159447 RepID=UPI0025D68B1B|nr:sulfurtransferase [uncultured Corynebacterium sp.]